MYNTPPTARITEPAEGTEIHPEERLRFAALVEDGQSEIGSLSIAWTSSLDGALVGTEATEGQSTAIDDVALSVGSHDITLLVVDPTGAAAEDAVTVNVRPNLAPTIVLAEPQDGAVFLDTEAIAVTARITDDSPVQPPVLALDWSGVEGELPVAPAEDGGIAAEVAPLPPGTYTLLLGATDASGDRAEASTTFEVLEADADEDGHVADTLGGDDCDDDDDAVHPGAEEVCNGVDDDCDGTTDGANATGATTWYADDDGDGYGDDARAVLDCAAPTGHVALAGDCDDADARFNPGADESDCADPNDYNCDGSVGYADIDGDGFAACEECDDLDPAQNPAADEVCNGEDDDCDGEIDEDSAVDAPTWYRDEDADSYGDPATGAPACAEPAGTVPDAGDCDDDDPEVNPAAPELCNAIDDDCDGEIDEDSAADASTWYADDDADGYGDPAAPTAACDAPAGTTADATDCDDTDAEVNPAATEICNGMDDDCDGEADEDTADDASTWYIDDDGDGYGDAAKPRIACAAPPGAVADATDCDDADSAVNPAATELCNGIDDDCDGDTDEDSAAGAPTWYADDDADGYGDAAESRVACAAPAGTTADATDCDDTDAEVNPAATEICNGIDDDCDGDTDEGSAADAATWYADADGDGYGDLATAAPACEQPTGTVADATDCDDSLSSVFPGATERCNGIDDDCDGETDEVDAEDVATWYRDADGDGYGDASRSLESCDAPGGYVADATDCDDSEPTTYPGAPETWYDGTDSDCDGANDYDQDGDGVVSVDYGGTDCDDTDPEVIAGRTVDVPGDYATIQAAIDAACPEDTIVVAAGTYAENVDFGGTDVDVVGAGAGSSVIDGGDRDTVVRIDAGSLSGFTIQGGAAAEGGGLLVSGSSPVALHDLDVTGNVATGDGGGAWIDAGAPVSIQSCTFSGNESGGDGGGLWGDGTGSEIALVDVSTDDNVATGSGGGASLSGAWTWDGGSASGNQAAQYAALSLAGTWTLADVVAEANLAEDDIAEAAGTYTIEGLDVEGNVCAGTCNLDTSGTATIDDFVFSWNIGGSTPEWNLSGSYTIATVAVIGNLADSDTGDSIDVTGSGSMSDVLVAGNGSVRGIYLHPSTTTTVYLRNATVVGASGAGLYVTSRAASQANLYNLALVDNGTYGLQCTSAYAVNLGYSLFSGNGTAAMSCTRASSSTTSGGNQEADPGFRTYAAWLGPGTWDLHPASGSALVDAGQPTLLDPDGSRSDVGALAGPYADPAAFTDADGDGLDAAWEEAHGLSDADASDAAEDADGDGATAAAEYAAGTDPTRADTDGDTSVDGDEAGAGTDPLDATFTPDAVVYAADSAAYLGTILAGGGDFDGDGAPDLAASGQYLGAALVVPGPFSGAVETSTSLITVALTPVAVALDGDITGDGLSDLLVARATTNGTLYVFEGGTSGTRTTTLAYATLTGNAAGDSMAATVAYADDVDGDGITDIFVGATGKDATASSAGGGYLVRSLGPGSSNVASVADLSVEGEAASDQAGASLDAGMDVDGDGIGDLLLGAPSNDGAASGGGAAYLVDGSLSGTALLSEATARTYGEFAGAGLGGSVALVGDTDGDGYGDWLVGAENRTTRGTILLFLGPSSGEIAPASADGTWYGEWDDAACGSAVARLDDLDGDARADWGLACQDYDSDAGMVAVVLGPGTGRHGVSDADARWRGDALDALGTTISRAGDTDGDGLDDAWFGAPRADEEGYTNNGAIQLLLGSTVP